MAWGSYYTASADFGGGATTGTWKNATGGAMTLPAVPSGASGTLIMYHTIDTGANSAVITAVTTTSWGVAQLVAGAGSSGVIQAIVGHSIIA